MVKKTKNEDGEELRHYHQMLGACIIHPDQKAVIPLCPEPIRKQDGITKNDCELVAFNRLINKIRQDHPKLALTITADALFSTGPNVRLLKASDMNFILGVKPGSHEKLFQSMDEWETRGKMNHFTKEEIIGKKIKKKRVHHFRYANKTLLNHADMHTSINFLEYWETTTWISPKGKEKVKKYHFSWATSFEINDDNIMQLMRGGRGRWKIENETFNTLKNQGYEFEHNFGHGYNNLSVVFAYLMFLAFLFDQIQQIGCKKFQQALKMSIRKKYFWIHIHGLFSTSYRINLVFKSWADLLDYSIGPPSAPDST
jgi:hypothetical protein